MNPKRERVVKGSCWPCKKRRIKCDLTQPRCRQCSQSSAQCNFGKILVRWNTRPTRTAPPGYQLAASQPPSSISPGLLSTAGLDFESVKTLKYFEDAVWPLLSTAAQPAPPLLAIALESQPVLLAVCELGDTHRFLSCKGTGCGRSDGVHGEDMRHRRSTCLAAVRRHLGEHVVANTVGLSQVLVAVLLLYFLDGYIDCTGPSNSTTSHHGGVRAILDALGGVTALLKKNTGLLKNSMQSGIVEMLLSQFATTDLTRAILEDRAPWFDTTHWLDLERGAVWWDRSSMPGELTLSLVFHAMAQISFYRHAIRTGRASFQAEVVFNLERRLQPRCPLLSPNLCDRHADDMIPQSKLERVNNNMCFTRAFQHCALIYMYRALCNLPPTHNLVQQQANLCLGAINAISGTSNILNCIIFPLYIVGAHSFTRERQRDIVEKINSIHRVLRFDCLLQIREQLHALWCSDNQSGSWSSMFATLEKDVLVL